MLLKVEGAGFLVMNYLYPKDGVNGAEVLHFEVVSKDGLELADVVVSGNEKTVVNIDQDDEYVRCCNHQAGMQATQTGEDGQA